MPMPWGDNRAAVVNDTMEAAAETIMNQNPSAL